MDVEHKRSSGDDDKGAEADMVAGASHDKIDPRNNLLNNKDLHRGAAIFCAAIIVIMIL